MTRLPYLSMRIGLGEGESGSENKGSSAYSKLESIGGNSRFAKVYLM